jgi:hypothetical protein
MGELTPPISLTAGHQTAGFDCGIDSLNEWLNRRAMKNESSRSNVKTTLPFQLIGLAPYSPLIRVNILNLGHLAFQCQHGFGGYI